MENEKANKKSMGVVIAIIVLVLAICAVVGGVFGYNLIQKGLLVNEVNELVSKKNLSKDTIDVEDIKTSGNYAKVEKAIKTYLNDYGTEIQKMIKIASDERMSKLLSTENYKNDGPEFTETLAFIDETTTSLNETSEKAMKLMEKEEMTKYIESYNLGAKYNELFQTLMLDADTEKELQTAKTELQESLDSLNKNLEIAKETINFLKEHKNDWHISGSMVMFNNQSLVNEYNTLIKKLK